MALVYCPLAMELIVVRHGRPERVEGIAGGADPALTDIGHRQAQEMARWLGTEELAAIYVSPMRRARETAAPLEKLTGLTATVVPDIREFDAEESSYIPMEELKQDKVAWAAFLAKRNDGHEAFHRSARGAMSELTSRHPGDKIAVVCHGGVINSVAADILGLEDGLFFAPDYSSINRFWVASNGTRSIGSLNDTGHLRPFGDLQLV